MPRPPYLVLYDGVCGMCHRLNRFVLDRDRADNFRFAALQGKLAGGILRRHGEEPAKLDTFYVVLGELPEQRLLARGSAAVFVLRQLGGVWKVLGSLLSLLPRSLLDFGYRLVASNRYLFGRYDTCPLPSARDRAKFLEAE